MTGPWRIKQISLAFVFYQVQSFTSTQQVMNGTGFFFVIWLVSILVLNLLANAEVPVKEFDPNNDKALDTGVERKRDLHEVGLLGLLDKDVRYIGGAEADEDAGGIKDKSKEEEIKRDGVSKDKDFKFVLHNKKVLLDQAILKSLDPLLMRPSSTHMNTPPDTVGKSTKAVFDDNLFDTPSFSITEKRQTFLDGSPENEQYSRFFVLTRSGYEYQGSPVPLRSIFSALQLRRWSVGDDKDQMNKDLWNSSNFGLIDKERVQRSIFPPDTRTMVTNTQDFPYSAIGRVDSGCTGTFIGPRHILTAAHCVYDPVFNKWQKNMDFRGAKTCDPNIGTSYKWKYVIITEGWKRFRWASYDFAMIVVDEPSPVWMEIGWKKPIPQYTVNINGYPGDKDYKCMWHSDCKLGWKSDYQLGYKCDTSYGMSGSSVYAQLNDTGPKVIYCVHAYGRNGGYNKCTRITESKFELLKYWMDTY